MANTISLNVVTVKGEDAGTVEVSAEVFGVKADVFRNRQGAFVLSPVELV